MSVWGGGDVLFLITPQVKPPSADCMHKIMNYVRTSCFIVSDQLLFMAS